MKIVANNNEVNFDAHTLLISKTDLKGKITYVNRDFMKAVNIKEKDLIGQPHNINRHPDMPRIIFKMLWQYLQNGQEIHAYVKNITSDGSFYWVFANITPSYFNSKIIGYHSARRKPSKEALEIVKPLYKKLLEAEKHGGMDASESLMQTLLNEKEMEYEEFILSF